MTGRIGYVDVGRTELLEHLSYLVNLLDTIPEQGCSCGKKSCHFCKIKERMYQACGEVVIEIGRPKNRKSVRLYVVSEDKIPEEGGHWVMMSLTHKLKEGVKYGGEPEPEEAFVCVQG